MRFRHPRYALLATLLACGGALLADGPLILIDEAILDRVEQVYSPAARTRVSEWSQLLARVDLTDDRARLEAVNRFFNRVRFVDDIDHWGEQDYWATPVEFLGSNGGDCEDFSIAKYLTLRHLGIPEARLRLVYVKALRLNQAHMVVAYLATPDAEPLILDNLVPAIRPASARRDLLPVYSFNGDSLWLAKQRGLGRAPVGRAEQISLWSQLQQRLRSGEWRQGRT